MTDPYTKQRNSKMRLGQVYFWTSTIKDWNHIIREDKYKYIILNILREQVYKGLISVYGFVIMPNHIHLIWEMHSKNGKEMPYASFNKAVGHLIIKDLKLTNSHKLINFKVNENERQYRIWQRDPLAILLDYRNKLEQKLNYIHNNPLQVQWQLVKYPEDYFWSSAKYYNSGIDDFGFLTDYRDKY